MPLEAHTVSRCCWIAVVDARADDLAAQRLALDIELVQDVARRKGARLLQQRDRPPAKFIDRHCRISPCSICVAANAVRAIRQERLLVAAVDESGEQQTFRRDAANAPACGPPGWRDRERANDIAAPMAAKAASRTMTSQLADNSCCGPAWSVLWPDPVRTASRHASSGAGAAPMMALLLGGRNSPWPSPNSASASVTAGKLAGAPSSTANSSASAATQTSMPDIVSSRAPRRS